VREWNEIEPYLKEARKYKLLTPREEIDLAREIRAGGPNAESARTRFIQANLRLVLMIVRRTRTRNMSIPDMVQEGNIGLMTAVEKYDPDKGFRFSTYAKWWIHHALSRSLSNTDQIRITPNRLVEIRQVEDARKSLEKASSEKPSLQEIAAAANMPVARVQEILNTPHVSQSLQSPIVPGADETVLDVYVGDEVEPSEDLYERNDLREKCARLFSVLNDREIHAVLLRFGDDEATLEEITKTVGVTRERVRQIIKKACQKMAEDAVASKFA
jgi:RNA polymerase primary sigma factor